jgi:2'-hydroxyisoflavone reductase
MRILVIGGNRFVGRAIVESALARGHEMTVVHRGTGVADPFSEATHIHLDRDGDLSALSNGDWEATVDASAYVPRQVASLADALDGHGGHYVYISSVSAYADPPGPGTTEDAPLAELKDPATEERTGETYGGLKALCESTADARFGDSLLIIRPTYVIGPHDYTMRFPTWVQRIEAGGEIVAPGRPDDPMQYIDARDQAEFIVDHIDSGTSGTFHTAAPSPPFGFGDMLDSIASVVAPTGTSFTWIESDELRERGFTDEDFPLHGLDGEDAWTMAVDPSHANAAGLSSRPLPSSIADTRAWLRTTK